MSSQGEERLDAHLSSLPPRLSTKQAQELLGLTSRLLYEHLAQGSLPGYQLPGGAWVILRDEVRDALIAGRLASGADLNTPMGHHRLDEWLAPLPERLSVTQIAATFEVSSVTARGWIRSGALTGYQIGKKWLVLRASLRDTLIAGANHS